LHSSFGYFTFNDEKATGGETETYHANKITFKSRPEHPVGGFSAKAEMLVHHTSDSGSKAIVSFLIEDDIELE